MNDPHLNSLDLSLGYYKLKIKHKCVFFINTKAKLLNFYMMIMMVFFYCFELINYKKLKIYEVIRYRKTLKEKKLTLCSVFLCCL